ncbi:uncharacterized protein K452DRAFT_311131 [Aplosporella prunicola CBS 121167]|uniref:Uncharacterized protein n=1 Tax=Aplosporella prunicola CBS 121167 TaxID=1176127 RepID=A0A6A6B9P0_9PEZI|nr:uncharacterized protein K452DRAFT_311131 [Aplosporella prunicola CBS 121167]KAF2139201.1 hypothetical protein K452DRAFT_311131 [Aplosporella prunicola CBS 121167]
MYKRAKMKLSWLLLAFCFHLSAGYLSSNSTEVSSESLDSTTTVTLTKTRLTSIVVTRTNSTTITTPSTVTPSTSSITPSITNTWTGKDSTDIASVLSCYAEKSNYVTRYDSWFSANQRIFESTYTALTSIWVGNTSRHASTLCDGWPRAPGSGLAYVPQTESILFTSAPSYPGPTPTCQYNYHGCDLLVSSYNEEEKTRSPTKEAQRAPNCVLDTSDCLIPAGRLSCRLDAGHVRLLYWDESKDPSALCTTDTHTTDTHHITSPPPTPVEPVTTVFEGFTLTSPTVYLSFESLYANLCLGQYTKTIIGVPPNSLSSIHFSNSPRMTTLPVTITDFNYPVPASAYTGMVDCWPSDWHGLRKDSCATIYDEDYLPHLVLPTDIALFTGLDPRLANCTKLTWRKYVFDPPQSMKRADHL